jgi:hypothetical protein
LDDCFYDPYEDEFDESDTDEVDDESHVYIYSRSSNDASTSTELLNDIMIHAALMQSFDKKNPGFSIATITPEDHA